MRSTRFDKDFDPGTLTTDFVLTESAEGGTTITLGHTTLAINEGSTTCAYLFENKK